ncbi:MAG: IS3 family transposase [Nitrospirales bacterium]
MFFLWSVAQRLLRLEGRPENRWIRQNRWLLSEIVGIWSKSREIYGSPRILQSLLRKGIHVSKHRVARLMRENGLRGRVVRVTRRQPKF